jgi:hypothetical protein
MNRRTLNLYAAFIVFGVVPSLFFGGFRFFAALGPNFYEWAMMYSPLLMGAFFSWRFFRERSRRDMAWAAGSIFQVGAIVLLWDDSQLLHWYELSSSAVLAIALAGGLAVLNAAAVCSGIEEAVV